MAFVCLPSAQASIVRIIGDNKSCLGSRISNDGHLLTNLDCLNSCISKRYGSCILSVDGIMVTAQVEFLGKGTKNYSVSELIYKTPDELIAFKKSKAFQGDGDFAILKVFHSQENQQCLSLNAGKIKEDQALFIKETADLVSVKRPFEISHHSPQVEMLKKIWNWIIQNPKQYLVYLYSTPYSLILSKPTQKFTKGGPVVTMKNKYVGPIVNFENEEGLIKVLRADKIFEQVSELLGYNQAIEFFNCSVTVK